MPRDTAQTTPRCIETERGIQRQHEAPTLRPAMHRRAMVHSLKALRGEYADSTKHFDSMSAYFSHCNEYS